MHSLEDEHTSKNLLKIMDEISSIPTETSGENSTGVARCAELTRNNNHELVDRPRIFFRGEDRANGFEKCESFGVEANEFLRRQNHWQVSNDDDYSLFSHKPFVPFLVRDESNTSQDNEKLVIDASSVSTAPKFGAVSDAENCHNQSNLDKGELHADIQEILNETNATYRLCASNTATTYNPSEIFEQWEHDISKLQETEYNAQKGRERSRQETHLKPLFTKFSIKRCSVIPRHRPSGILQAPMELDIDGLPIPIERPHPKSLPRCKKSWPRSSFPCCCGSQVSRISKRLKELESQLSATMKPETATVFQAITDYRRAMRNSLADLSDTLYTFKKKIKAKESKGSTIDSRTTISFVNQQTEILSRLRTQVAWLVRLMKDLRVTEKVPQTILAILHSLAQSGAILSMESNQMTKSFFGVSQNMKFETQLAKFMVDGDGTLCAGSGSIRMVPSSQVADENTNNNNDIRSTESSQSETTSTELERLLSFLKNNDRSGVLEPGNVSSSKNSKPAKPRSSRTSRLARGDAMHSSSKCKELRHSAGDDGDSSSTVMNQLISHLKKYAKENTDLDSDAEKETSLFHSCLDANSAHTTLCDIESIARDRTSISDPKLETFVKETSTMVTAVEYAKSASKSESKDALRNDGSTSHADEMLLQPKLIEIIHKVNQLARANNRVVRRIRSLEACVGKLNSHLMLVQNHSNVQDNLTPADGKRNKRNRRIPNFAYRPESVTK